MSLKYDFDIRWSVPQEAFDGTAVGAILNQTVQTPNARRNFTAHFRSQDTIDTILAADARLKQVFEASGFEMSVHDSGVGDWNYPAHDEVARNDIMRRLSEVIPMYRLKAVDLNGFDFDAFVDYVMTAEAVRDGEETERPVVTADTPIVVEQRVQEGEKSFLPRIELDSPPQEPVQMTIEEAFASRRPPRDLDTAPGAKTRRPPKDIDLSAQSQEAPTPHMAIAAKDKKPFWPQTPDPRQFAAIGGVAAGVLLVVGALALGMSGGEPPMIAQAEVPGQEAAQPIAAMKATLGQTPEALDQ